MPIKQPPRPRIAYRPVNGIFLMDKPAGITSQKALQIARRYFRAQKAGHTGSLDPLATGMLPLCFGEATKISQYLLESDKQYVVEARWGVRTDTGDRDGAVIDRSPVPELSDVLLESHLSAFRGLIEQVPPMYSALKREGRPLYQLARQGIVVDRPARPVTIYALELCEWSQHTISLKVTCSKGTYIRSLITDLGDVLGCGATVTSLRRLAVAGFCESQMLSVEALQAEGGEAPTDSLLARYLCPVSEALPEYPHVDVSEAQMQALRCGQKISLDSRPCCDSQRVCVWFREGQICVGFADYQSNGDLVPKRLFNSLECFPSVNAD